VAKRDLDTALSRLTDPAGDEVEKLTALVDALRRPPRRAEAAAATLRQLIGRIEVSPVLAQSLRDALLQLVAGRRAVHCLTDVGILSADGFFTLLSRRLSNTLLPEAVQPDTLKDQLGVIFHKPNDYRWLAGLPRDELLHLMHLLDFRGAGRSPAGRAILLQLLDALQVMSYRITAIGLEPEIVRVHPEIERYESPFLMQNVEMRAFIDAQKLALQERSEPTLDDKHLQVLLAQCHGVIARIRKQAESTGASISLTYLLVRLRQNLDRCGLLLSLLQPRPDVDRNSDVLELLLQLVAGENRKNSIRDLFRQNLELLALRIAGHAGRSGETYITTTRAEYYALFRSATGAGLLVAFMAAIKLWLAREPHAPFVEAVRFSSMYAVGFVLMTLWHFSLATKQPALTAHRIARSLDEPAKGHDRLDGLTELIVRTLRSQFIAILGNFVVVMPLSAALAYLAQRYLGYGIVDAGEVAHLREGLDPLRPAVWFWGAMTGVWLFVCGLISGYYDNKAVYDRIAQRIRQLRGLRRLIGARALEHVAGYIDANLGAIAGSAAFGVFLGSTAAVGKVLGAPLDTLHVTFSAANWVYAEYGDAAGPFHWREALRYVLGIGVIGSMNILVSFGLAVFVAARAQRVRVAKPWLLLRKLGVRLLRTPGEFFFPPKDSVPGRAGDVG
jgi:site-specific recombinase